MKATTRQEHGADLVLVRQGAGFFVEKNRQGMSGRSVSRVEGDRMARDERFVSVLVRSEDGEVITYRGCE